jgi:hypothetical protein
MGGGDTVVAYFPDFSVGILLRESHTHTHTHTQNVLAVEAFMAVLTQTASLLFRYLSIWYLRDLLREIVLPVPIKLVSDVWKLIHWVFPEQLRCNNKGFLLVFRSFPHCNIRWTFFLITAYWFYFWRFAEISVDWMNNSVLICIYL